MDEFKEIGTVLEIHGTKSRLRYEWKIDDFMSVLEDRYDGCYFSKVFRCGGNAWYMELIPNLLVEDESRLPIVELGLHRACWIHAESVSVTVGVCKVDGTKIQLIKRTETFAEEQKSFRVAFMDKGYFLQNRHRLLSSGRLTVFLYMNTEVVAEENNYTEEEQILDEKSGAVFRGDLWRTFQSGEDTDVTFRVADHDFRAHRFVVRARSPVFNGMLAHDMAESNSGLVTIADCDPAVFRLFLCFVYTGVVQVPSVDSAIPLFFLADKYDFPALRAHCLQFMMDNLETFSLCDVVRLAILHKEEVLLEKATEFFADHINEIVAGEAWLDFLKEVPYEASRLFRNGLKVLTKEN